MPALARPPPPFFLSAPTNKGIDGRDGCVMRALGARIHAYLHTGKNGERRGKPGRSPRDKPDDGHDERGANARPSSKSLRIIRFWLYALLPLL